MGKELFLITENDIFQTSDELKKHVFAKIAETKNLHPMWVNQFSQHFIRGYDVPLETRLIIKLEGTIATI